MAGVMIVALATAAKRADEEAERAEIISFGSCAKRDLQGEEETRV
jgi:hypothetical protein